MSAQSRAADWRRAAGLASLGLFSLVLEIVPPDVYAAPQRASISISISDASATESSCAGVSAVFTVQLSRPSKQAVSVAFATADGTAMAGADYVAQSGVVTFQARETTKVIAVTILDDQITESPETFFVNLRNPINATISDGQGQGTIFNDLCDDASLCTVDSCDPATLTCLHTAVSCDDGNVCTVDSCNPSTGCVNTPGNAGTVCRASAGVCDPAESCTGTAAACPADAKSTAVCRPSAGPCDIAESCDGVSNDCPADEKKADGTACSLPNAVAQCAGGACAIASCNAGYGDCDGSPADGCEAPLNVAQSTSPDYYGGGSNADLKAGYLRVSAITNCGGCGVSCDDGASCTTDLCVPTGSTGQEVAVCRHYNRAQCSEARCNSQSLPSGTPPPLEPSCMGPDADGDGLPNQWETSQTDPYTGSQMPPGVDLNCDGEISDAGGDLVWHEPPSGDSIPDVYLELDYMVAGPDDTADHSPPINPLTGESALTEIVRAFSREGITLHIDPAQDALPHSDVLFFPGSSTDQCPTAGAVNFYDIKGSPAYFDPRRRFGYHYVVSGHSNCVDPGSRLGETNGSGVAEIFGNDLVVSMGGFSYGATTDEQVRRYREYAGAIMHEIGHNLRLDHGAPVPCPSPPCDNSIANYAPNHISSMNYSFQLSGIQRSATPGTTSPLDPNLPWRVDFSHGLEQSLNEGALDENLGLNVAIEPFNRDLTVYFCFDVPQVAPSFGPIDWNCDGVIESSVAADINGDGILGILPNSDDWRNLFFNFQCQPTFAN